MFVCFDLPVVSKKDRKIATKFRNALLDVGFAMMQFSVYIKYCGSRERVERYISFLKTEVPEKGNVSVFVFTDKQFGDAKVLYGTKKYDDKKTPEKNEQLSLF
jgi:CRISPR-associated protein Cas2